MSAQTWNLNDSKSLGSFLRDCREEDRSKNKFRLYVTYIDDETQERTDERRDVRLGLTYDNSPIVMRKGSTKWGTSLDHYLWGYKKTHTLTKVEWLVPKPRKTEEQKFNDRVDKVEGYLKKYNLWPDLQATLRLYRLLGFELTREISRESWFSTYGNVTRDNIQQHIDNSNRLYRQVKEVVDNCDDNELKEIVNKLESYPITTEKDLSGFVEEYREKMKPFIGVEIHNVGYITRDYNVLIHSKIKKMTFHKSKWNKSITEYTLEQIKEHMEKGEKYTTSGRNGYDVSFEYKPASLSEDGKARAWYSEEYRGCGNGHYYLALDDQHALYYEDD